MGALLRGDGSFSFVAEVDGDDIVVTNVTATWFGGPNDPRDSGETASGVSTRDDPGILGCALPMDGFHFSKTDGSPIPRLPWRTQVRVRNRQTNLIKVVPLIDLGPSKTASSHAAIDLTQSAFQLIGGNLDAGVIKVDYTVVGGARFVQSAVQRSRSIRTSERFALASAHFVASPDNLPAGHTNSKPPIQQFIKSPNFSSRNGAAIDMVVMHYTDGPTVQGAINRFLDPKEQVSAHYIIDRDGAIYQMVDDSDKAWHARAANRTSIGIEHVSMPGQGMFAPQEQASISLVNWLVATYQIPLQRILGHRFAPGNEGATDCPDGLFGAATEDAVSAWVKAHIHG